MRDIVLNNFDKIADLASRNNAIVMRGPVGSHFNDEVLSWHNINGEDAEKLLPGLLSTTKHPHYFRERNWNYSSHDQESADKLLLIPLRELCKSPSDVGPIMERIFDDIRTERPLSQFAIAKEVRAGRGRHLLFQRRKEKQ